MARMNRIGMFRLLLLSLGVLAGAVAAGTVQANNKYAALVIDARSGQVLHARSADAQRHPASLTKIMTLYMVFDAIEDGRLTMDQALPVSRTAAGRSPSKLYLKPGETIRVRDGILSLVTKSANDVATVFAEALSGSERQFAQDMTAMARRLGMRSTVFKNASGLPHWQQVTTARDMGRLARALMWRFPKYYPMFATQRFSYRGKRYKNHNDLLGRYPGLDGIKTGYIRASGFNLVASAQRDGRRLIGVVMGGKSARSRGRQMVSLLNKGFVRLSRRHGPREAELASGVAPPPPAHRPSGLRLTLDTVPALPAERRIELAASGWSVQVGAYRSAKTAERKILQAAGISPELLSRGTVSIESVTRSNGTKLYRARLTGLGETTAREACSQLQARAMNCLLLPPAESSVSG